MESGKPINFLTVPHPMVCANSEALSIPSLVPAEALISNRYYQLQGLGEDHLGCGDKK